jgi:hypothetical protein
VRGLALELGDRSAQAGESVDIHSPARLQKLVRSDLDCERREPKL